MSKYRKKPVTIDASQWFKNGDHPRDYTLTITDPDGTVYGPNYRREHDWEGDVVRYFRHPDVPGDRQCEKCEKTMHDHGWIDTLEGGHIVCPGDWIITGVEGERYPCKPSVFAATYDEVRDA